MLGSRGVDEPSIIQRGVDLNDQVYATLKDRLLARVIGPRDRLRLQALADELGVSRSPVHHALTRLTTEGLVSVDRRGYSARPVTATLMFESHNVRCALELYAAEQSVGGAGAAQLEEFRRLLERTVQSVENFEFVDKRDYMLANKAFHEYLVDIAGNETLSATYRSLCVHQLMERALAGDAIAAGDSTAEHRRIVAAYEAGDLAAAREAIIANVETGKQLALGAIEEAGGVL